MMKVLQRQKICNDFEFDQKFIIEEDKNIVDIKLTLNELSLNSLSDFL